MSNFNVAYSAGGNLDKIKKVGNIEEINNIENIDKIDSLSEIERIETLKNIENLEQVKSVEKLESVSNIDNLNEVNVVNEIKAIGSIRGFASKTQPYNYMRLIEVPALRGVFEEEIVLSPSEVEILAISVTCSGYGENDHYNLYFNGQLWFKDWYLGEVKEGLFLGSSTYVYLAPPDSRVVLKFHNDSGTSKKLWFGIRMLKDPEPI
ncbi:TPA: hypothetical protein KON86_004441 [Clostridioides difficile]|uniref:hypothetical protein n=1 Tax=Clostridioides difficile TaxID=1496 RepID=UPI00030C9CEA|nr:hypothetical protein [Clostridioides difficile]MDK3178334.1 hypothetical protein [Clostridioides difficile]MDV9594565.1 hypothetical protein [Clostridioides difficile]HBF0841555.1 hypothetical protein [Clostridioides difficile]HBF0845278.1 hypothetical protein [Clostridioides difficile]HBF4440426.1 hypothetical protein [Clostridioides difficile]